VTLARALPLVPVVLVAWAGLASLAGCASDPHSGYVLGTTYDKGVRTVAVPVFENTTFTPGLEQQLTEAIVREIQTSTPWAITGQSRADTVLTGVLEGIELDRLTRTRNTGYVQEQAVALRVNFRWIDRRTGDVRVERERFAGASTFVPARGVEGESGERIEIGQRDAIEDLARAIVAELRADF
jgi:hypothetical protein